MLRALLVLAFVGPIFISGGSQTTGTPPADTFVTLAESSLYGSSGTLADLTDRVRIPRLLDKPDTSSWTVNSTFRDDVCSSDDTTFDAIIDAANSADQQTIYLPDDCAVRVSVDPSTGSNAENTLSNSMNMIDFACHAESTDGVCGLVFYPRDPDGDAEWRYASGDVARVSIGKYPIAVGSARSTAITSCTWTGGYGLNNRRIEVSGCDLSTWGVGDIVRLKAVGEPDTTAERWDWLTRITCIDNTDDGVANGTGTECDQLTTSEQQIQIRSGLPRDYTDGAYFWGDTTGESVELLESVGSSRGGTGTETDNVAEDIWFSNMFIDFERDELFTGSGIRWTNVVDGGVYDVVFGGCNASCMTFGGSSSSGASNSAQAGSIRVLHSKFTDMVADANCFSEVVQIFAENPARIRVYNGGTVCDFDFAGDPLVEFDEDVSEPTLRNQTFERNVATNNGDGTSTFTLTGLDGTAFSTAGGGLVTNHDAYNTGLTYCNAYASDIQFVNVSAVGVRQGPLYQTGCAGHTIFGMYLNNGLTVDGLRGEFAHGNGAAPGSHMEMSQFDLAIVPMANSNPAEGEGTNRTWFKNRGVNVGTLTWPPGTATSTWQCASGSICVSEQPDHNGTTNEDWSMFENVFQRVDAAGDEIDDGAIGGDGGVSAAPHSTYNLAFYRNRAVASGYNLDANLELSSGDNPTTDTDVTGSNTNGTNYEDDDVPAAYTAEVAGVPTALAVTATPDWWCAESGTFGEMGAHYDDFNGGTLSKLPAQIRSEGTTCTCDNADLCP
jgi:hypothetical protein